MLSDLELERIARLARLHINASEKPEFAQKLTNILHLADQLAAVNTDGVAPLTHVLAVSQRLREDEVTEVDQREVMQMLAPSVADGLYLVPKVIE
jgi:aspartyl-tRNA(Asn)/glutamyl-tRNA(Gln) amidotransferase subunit C